MMEEELIIEKKYNKILSSIDKVAKLYHFNYIHNPLNKYDKGIYYFKDDLFIISYKIKNDFEYVEGISFLEAIFKAFSIKLNIELSNNNSLFMVIEKYLNKDIFIIDHNIEGVNIYSNSILAGSIKLGINSFTATIERDKLFKIILESGKNLNITDNLHVIFISDKEASSICYKAMNVCRIGGLSCKMVYDNFTDSDIEPTRFLVDFDLESTINNTVNIKDMISDNIEEITISDIYPYIINKINKLSKCSSCKEE